MPFIATAIVGAVGLAGTTAGAILGGVINVGIAGGLAYASSALTGSKTPQAQTGIQTDVEMGGGQPRGCTYGRVGVAGYLAYANTFFVSNNFIDLVYVIGDGPHDGLDAVWVNGTRHTLSVIAQGPDSVGYQVDGVIGETGASHLTLSFYRGYSDQAADAQLVAGANPAGRWTAQDRLAGVCYVLVRGFYSEQAFPNGIPSLVFEVRGRRLYDWRRTARRADRARIAGAMSGRGNFPTTRLCSSTTISAAHGWVAS